ncbi:MAG: type III pantothenate kinase [Candidatus Krumholzibacteria bacterium]|nr:type III pantothenate kinase [Candidatus Krumholzibacteria bacterium]
MKALIIDAGNTCVTCAAWQGKHQYPSLAVGSPIQLAPPVPLDELGSLSHPSVGEEGGTFQASLQRIFDESGRPPVVLVSVVPGVIDLFPEDMDLEVVDHASDLPFRLDVAEPAQVGPDRLCNMAAVAMSGLASALVVDAGTATTFDLMVDGVFLGGMIAPGMAFAARQLGEAASRLNPVPFGPASWDVGRDTRSAMASGAWHTGTGGIRSVVDGLCTRYGPMPVVITGGLGRHFENQDWHFDPYWTLRGAAILANL